MVVATTLCDLPSLVQERIVMMVIGSVHGQEQGQGCPDSDHGQHVSDHDRHRLLRNAYCDVRSLADTCRTMRAAVAASDAWRTLAEAAAAVWNLDPEATAPRSPCMTPRSHLSRAALLLEQPCQRCGSGKKAQIRWPFPVRLCRVCFRETTICEKDVRAAWPDSAPALAALPRTGKGGVALFLRRDVERAMGESLAGRTERLLACYRRHAHRVLSNGNGNGSDCIEDGHVYLYRMCRPYRRLKPEHGDARTGELHIRTLQRLRDSLCAAERHEGQRRCVHVVYLVGGD